MTITILYFARFKEALGCDKEQFELAPDTNTVSDVIDQLVTRGPQWQSVLRDEKVLIAVNQSVASASNTITDGDELAFFPPVTGG